MGAGQGVMKEMSRFAEPESIVLPRHSLRNQNVLRYTGSLATPARPPATRFASGVSQQGTPIRISVIVEGKVAFDHHNVIAGVPDARLYPNCRETKRGEPVHERIGQDVAGPSSEKHTIRQAPSFLWIIFEFFVDDVHVRSCIVRTCAGTHDLGSGPGMVRASTHPAAQIPANRDDHANISRVETPAPPNHY